MVNSHKDAFKIIIKDTGNMNDKKAMHWIRGGQTEISGLGSSYDLLQHDVSIYILFNNTNIAIMNLTMYAENKLS